MFIVSVTVLLKPKSAIEFFATLALICSPAVLLGMERANVDLFIFALITFSLFLSARTDEWSCTLGIFAAFAATVLKLYPVVAMISIPVMAESRRRFLATLMLVLGLLLAWVSFDFKQLLLLSETIPRPTDSNAFGGTLLFTYLRIERAFWLSCLLATVLTVGATVLTKWVGGIQALPNTQEDRRSVVFYCVGFVIVFFCFISNTNYDYRFIFFLLMVPCLLQIVRLGPKRTRMRFWALTSLVLMILFAWSAIFLRLPGLPDQYLWLAKPALSWILMFFLMVVFMRTVMMQNGYAFRYSKSKLEALIPRRRSA